MSNRTVRTYPGVSPTFRNVTPYLTTKQLNLMEVAGRMYMYLVIHVKTKESRRQNDNKLLHETKKKGINM